MLKNINKLLIAGVAISILLSSVYAQDKKYDNTNHLSMAVAWKQTAAEYKALYYQAYNIAHDRIQRRLKSKKGNKPLAILMDMDDTILNTTNYWGHLINNNKDFFDDVIWDKWIPENKVVPTPGSKAFLDYCKDNGIEVFYITSRNQGPKTYDYAMDHLKVNGFPYADDDHLTVLRESSNKLKKQQIIAKDFEIVLLMGDSLNDFDRIYYVPDVDKRTKIMESTKEKFGRKFILLPNPTDGHWIKAIFGESEPPANDKNREKLQKAATKSSWKQ